MSFEEYIHYAIKIAKNGNEKTSPNPMVGALLVYKDKIISEAWHKAFGEKHAEKLAIQNLPPQYSNLLKESTLFVSLEPCNHQGKTEACTDLILQSGIRKVVFGAYDPNPLMSGKSIELLRNKGIECIGPLNIDYQEEILKYFRINITKKRPYIILKIAQTADFFMGQKNQEIKISGRESDCLTHKWRSESDAILTTSKTFEIDKPSLNVRYWTGRNPLKFLIGSIRNESINDLNAFKNFIQIKSDPETALRDVFINLYESHRIGRFMIEAGPTFVAKVISENIWDEARVITNTKFYLKKGLQTPYFKGRISQQFMLGNDEIKIVSNTMN
ncbi:MAG: bifunctional diaminohydroxyphosphoribosylaminopyrimidine deaminase/5-amino-6-(5-phosphoribosylamino)uracil reductase RibD [Saprospiraceae bacterium]|nr:bifunctional diaminohydroxyphosphoribosylaminopyrimidine deaminase/5-amino-6-(5-phosphoribosylamino)uracil reductase RibD [Saprospiraceae bacterium]